MEFRFSVQKIWRLLGELPQKQRDEYTKAEGLDKIDKYILNRLKRIENATMDDLKQIVEDAYGIHKNCVIVHFGDKSAFVDYCFKKFQGKVQTFHFHGNRTEVKGFNILDIRA